jgi:transcriptional regulator with XRE-family HTH domain
MVIDDLSNLVQAVRAASGLSSNEKLAKKLFVTLGTINRWLSGDYDGVEIRDVNGENLMQLATEYGIIDVADNNRATAVEKIKLMNRAAAKSVANILYDNKGDNDE